MLKQLCLFFHRLFLLLKSSQVKPLKCGERQAFYLLAFNLKQGETRLYKSRVEDMARVEWLEMDKPCVAVLLIVFPRFIVVAGEQHVEHPGSSAPALKPSNIKIWK